MDAVHEVMANAEVYGHQEKHNGRQLFIHFVFCRNLEIFLLFIEMTKYN